MISFDKLRINNKLSSLNGVNCWKPRSDTGYNVTREGERECLKTVKYVAISSQAPQECAEGSTTNEYSPNVTEDVQDVIMGHESTRVRRRYEAMPEMLYGKAA